ncbi:MAG: SDR family oxidoreductase [Bacteroidota bacterium]
MDKEYVIVTGGSNGIGAGIAQRLEKDGLSPIILDLVPPKDHSRALYEQVDLSDVDTTKQVLVDLCEKYQILRLVNNVGLVRPALLEDTTTDDFMTIMQLNAQTAMLCLQAVLPAMRKANFGRVVTITSRTVLGKEKRTAYSASKGALGAMTRTWALELAQDGITVNAVAPGPIETEAFKKNNPPDSPATKAIIDRVPVKRMGQPTDVANATSFFLNAKSSFVTGQTLYVCGGITVGQSN